ncbi:restriction endonuclease subunit S [Prosthecobacter sp.]|uniref:restriction endonuclease subunit S n=1 Tax=Prosthecobacter sp. TaxID=1965333 RepID=UPI003783C706
MRFRKLSEIAPSGASPAKPAPDETVWHLTLDQIESGSGKIGRRSYGRASDAGTSTFVFDTGNVLYSKLRPYLNKVICPDSSGIATTELVPLRPIPGELNREFLCFYLRSPEFVSWASAQVDGAKMPRMKMKSFWAHEMPLPPLDDQIRIANLLGKVEGLIAQRKHHLQQLDDLLKSVFLEMFGDPVRNEKGWDKPELKAFGKISTGNTPPRNEPANYDGDFIEWIKTDNITGDAVFVTPATEHLSEVGARKARTVTAGALLVACIAGSVESIGRAALTNRTVSFNQQINAIQPGKDVNPLYLYGLFKLSRAYIQSHATKGMKKILTKGDFEKITMIKPPFELQNQFAVVVEKIEGIKSRYQQSLTDFESLYGALSQQAFKGELDLSRVPMPGIQAEEEETVAVEPLHTPAEQSLVIHLPDTANLLAALESTETRMDVLVQWLDAYRGQLGSTPFSVQHFMAAAQTRLAELHPDNDFELGANDYEHIKAWVFEALAAGRLAQAFDDAGNRIELKAEQA